MYGEVAKHQAVSILYGDQLMTEGVVTAEDIEEMGKKYWGELDVAMKAAPNTNPRQPLASRKWSTLRHGGPTREQVATGVSEDELLRIGAGSVSYPEGFHIHKRLLVRTRLSRDHGLELNPANTSNKFC